MRMSKMQKYKMRRLLQEGPRALLHEAKNVKKDEMVLIKELKKKYYTQEDCNGNREVQVQSKMQHSNIVKMLEMFHDDTELLMVLEYNPLNLKTLLKTRDKPLCEAETKRIMSQIFSALAFIHKRGYVHCALMPESVMCNEEGTIVKVTDFSLSKSLSDQPFPDMTLQPTWYMSPEVLLGSETYCTPVDVWAAGCIMAELLAGKPLLKGDNNQTQMLKICDFLGTFTRSDWPEGVSLLLNINYNLPKNAPAQGFSGVGFEASSDAKEVILNLLKWNPLKRKTAEQWLSDGYFAEGQSGGGAGDQGGPPHEYQLQRLESWKNRWGGNIASESLEEFDVILQELATSRQPDGAHHRGGDMVQRGGGGGGGGRGSGMSRASLDNGLGLDLTQRHGRDTNMGDYLETERGNMDTHRGEGPGTGMDRPRTGLEEELVARQERRDRQTILNNDDMFREYFGEGHGNNGQGQGQGQGQSCDQDQGQDFGPSQEHGSQCHGQGQGQQQGGEPRYNARGIPVMTRADRLKQNNPVKYETIYGRGLNFALGGQGEDGRSTDIYGNSSQGNHAGQQKNQVSNSGSNNANDMQRGSHGQTKQQHNSYNNKMQAQDNILESGDPDQSLLDKPDKAQPRRDRALNEIKFKDHESAAKRLYANNVVKYHQVYGNPDMRHILGKKPRGSRKLPDDEESVQDAPANSKYTPTWAEKGRAPRGNRA